MRFDEEQSVTFKELLNYVRNSLPANLRLPNLPAQKKVDYVYRCLVEASDKARFQVLRKVWLGVPEGTRRGILERSSKSSTA